jgi:hypothetical protein
MTKDYYFEKRGKYCYFRFAINGQRTHAFSSGQANKTLAEKWARKRFDELTSKPLTDLSLFMWAERFFIDGCPYITRLRIEGRTFSPRTIGLSRQWLVNYVLNDPICEQKLSTIRRADVLSFRERIAKDGRTRTAQAAY